MTVSIKSQLYCKGLHSSLFQSAAALECYSCENFWTESDIAHLMSSPHVGGLVFSKHLTSVAYIVYELNPALGEITLLNLVVHPDFRRQKLATDFINCLSKMSKLRNMTSIVANVRESNLAAHLFLKSNGFVATGVVPRYFQDVYEYTSEVEDAYSFKKEI